MNAFKKAVLKIFVLIKDLFLMGYKMVKQMVLPNKKTKGNVISSLFVFFIGIIERLNCFEHGFFSMAAIFRQKYIKQTVVVICTLLFFLSSFEWTSARGPGVNEKSHQSEQLSQKTKKINTNKRCQLIDVKPMCFNETHSTAQGNLYDSPKLKEKKFLLIHSLKI